MSSIHSPLLSHSLSEFLRPVPVKRRPVRAFFTRLAHAWRLARSRLTEEDARALYLQCQNKLGWYTLDLLTTNDAIEAAREVFNDNPELPRLIAEACATVGQRWNATENTAKARERVFELAETLSKTEDLLISFPLSRRSAPSQQIAPSPIHTHYAPRRLAQIPHYSKTNRDRHDDTHHRIRPCRGPARRMGPRRPRHLSRWQTPYRNPGLYPASLYWKAPFHLRS